MRRWQTWLVSTHADGWSLETLVKSHFTWWGARQMVALGEVLLRPSASGVTHRYEIRRQAT